MTQLFRPEVEDGDPCGSGAVKVGSGPASVAGVRVGTRPGPASEVVGGPGFACSCSGRWETSSTVLYPDRVGATPIYPLAGCSKRVGHCMLSLRTDVLRSS